MRSTVWYSNFHHRHTRASTCLIEDVIKYTETMNVHGAVLFLDFKKVLIPLIGNLCFIFYEDLVLTIPL